MIILFPERVVRGGAVWHRCLQESSWQGNLPDRDYIRSDSLSRRCRTRKGLKHPTEVAAVEDFGC